MLYKKLSYIMKLESNNYKEHATNKKQRSIFSKQLFPQKFKSGKVFKTKFLGYREGYML